MTDEEYRIENERKAQLRAERQVIVRQQRQEENDLEFLSYEDPSLYKALMEKRAIENAAITAANPPTDFGTLAGPNNAFQSGQTRMNFIESQRDRPVSSNDPIAKTVGGGEYGMGVGDFIGGGFVDALDGWKYLKGTSQRNRDARALLTQELVDEGYSTGSMDFYKEFTKRLPEPEGSGEALFDVGVGAVEGITLGAAKAVTTPLKFIVKGGAARFLKGLSAKLTTRAAPSGRGALPTANTAVEQAVRQDYSASGVLPQTDQGITAFHGSPYKFKKFDSSKIGSGEGAQVYGRGLYFGEAEGTGKTYRDQLSGGSTSAARRTLEAADGDVDRAIEETQEKLYRLQERNAAGVFDDDQRMFNMQKQIGEGKLDQLREYKDSGRFNSGSLYEVKIDADPNDFLNYDLPVDKQPKKLAEAIKAIAETQSIPVLNQFGESASFGSFLDALTDKIGAKNATQAFTDAGIPGTKYLDQNSRSVGKGTRNFVVFDDRLVRIVKNYGIAGAATMLGVTTLDVERAMAEGLLGDGDGQGGS